MSQSWFKWSVAVAAYTFGCQGRGEYGASGGGVGMPSVPILLLLQFDVYLICVGQIGSFIGSQKNGKETYRVP